MKLNKEVRKKHNLTQAQIGEMLGISTSAVGMYEQGRRRLPADIVFTLATFFHIPAESVVTDRPTS